MSVYQIDRYQNAIPRAMLLHELKKAQPQECFTLNLMTQIVTHDSIGHLETLCMSILSLNGGVESEWKRYSSSHRVEKTLAF